MRFGLWTKDQIYGYVSKMPEKQEVQVNKEVTMGIFAEIEEALAAMYEQDNKEFL